MQKISDLIIVVLKFEELRSWAVFNLKNVIFNVKKTMKNKKTDISKEKILPGIHI